MADAQTPHTRPIAPLSQEQLGQWRARLDAARDVAKELVTQGRKNLGRYTAKTLRHAPKDHTIVVPLDYASVEQKKAQLFFQVPEIQLDALRPECEAAAPIFAAVLNHALGPQGGVNAKAMMFEALTDVLCPMGFAVTKIGYENVVDGTKPVVIGQEPVAVEQPGAVLGLQTTTQMQPVIAQVPNIISETYYWRRIPPGFLLAPKEFRGSNFDEAAFLAWRFSEDVPEGTGYTGSEKDRELLLSEDQKDGERVTPKRCGVEVWYKASRFDPQEKRPEAIRTFKLYDDEPIARDHRESPYQRWAPDGTLIGMRGFPLHVLTLRYLSDSAFPPSDVQMGGFLSDEISLGRTQLLQRRNRSLPQVLVDGTRVDDPTMGRLERNENTGFVKVPGNPSEMFLSLDKGQFGRENFAFNDQAQQDYDRTWALGANAGVLKADSPETATKSNLVQRSIETRLEAERTRVLEWFVSGAMKLAGLYQIFADDEDYVRIGGVEAPSRLQAWDKTTVAGQFAFKARPNSHIRLDAAEDYKQELDFFNLAGNAPEGNRMYMLQRLAAKRGMDPMKALQAPPPKTPDPSRVSISVKGEDFIGPQAPLVLEMLQQQGIQFSAEAIAASQQALALMGASQQAMGPNAEDEHGGAMEGGGEVEPINKHSLVQTGGMQGVGA